jgi:hypothetical protein
MYMAQDVMLRAFKAALGMEPVALNNYYVQVIANTGTYVRKVSFYEAIPPFQVTDLCQSSPRGPLQTATALAAGTLSAKLTINNYGLWQGEFGQWRFFPLDDAQYFLFVPAGNAKWSLKNIQVGIDKSIFYRDPLLVTTEFFTWQEEWPAFQALNFTAYSLPACRIITFGYRYHTDPIVEAAAPGQAAVPNSNAPYGTLAGINAGTVPCTIIYAKAQAGSGN